jgi:hypothetical protein
MQGEIPSPSEAIEASARETKSPSVAEFVRQALTPTLDRMTQKVPERLREQARQLARAFQEEFAALLAVETLRVELTTTQASYVKTAVVEALDFAYVARAGKVDLLKNKSQLLTVATYINSLRP